MYFIACWFVLLLCVEQPVAKRLCLDYLGRATGHVACKLQQNTRSLAFVVAPAQYDAPLLQLAINTLPSLHPGKCCGLKTREAEFCNALQSIVSAAVKLDTA